MRQWDGRGLLSTIEPSQMLGDSMKLVATKGGDWVPAMTALWDAADSLLNKDDLDAKEDYVNSMNWLAEVSGAQWSA